MWYLSFLVPVIGVKEYIDICVEVPKNTLTALHLDYKSNPPRSPFNLTGCHRIRNNTCVDYKSYMTVLKVNGVSSLMMTTTKNQTFKLLLTNTDSRCAIPYLTRIFGMIMQIDLFAF